MATKPLFIKRRKKKLGTSIWHVINKFHPKSVVSKILLEVVLLEKSAYLIRKLSTV